MADRTPLEDVLRRAYDANLRYWEIVGRATTDYVQTVSRIWADAPVSWMPGIRPNRQGGFEASGDTRRSYAEGAWGDPHSPGSRSWGDPHAPAGRTWGDPHSPGWGDPHAPAALLLEGMAGSEARAVVMLSNDLGRDVEAEVVASPLIGPGGEAVAFKVRTDPEIVRLAPGQRAPVTLMFDVSEQLTPGVDYSGEVSVPGLAPRGVPVIVRRR